MILTYRCIINGSMGCCVMIDRCFDAVPLEKIFQFILRHSSMQATVMPVILFFRQVIFCKNILEF